MKTLIENIEKLNDKISLSEDLRKKEYLEAEEKLIDASTSYHCNLVREIWNLLDEKIQNTCNIFIDTQEHYVDLNCARAFYHEVISQNIWLGRDLNDNFEAFNTDTKLQTDRRFIISIKKNYAKKKLVVNVKLITPCDFITRASAGTMFTQQEIDREEEEGFSYGAYNEDYRLKVAETLEMQNYFADTKVKLVNDIQEILEEENWLSIAKKNANKSVNQTRDIFYDLEKQYKNQIQTLKKDYVSELVGSSIELPANMELSVGKNKTTTFYAITKMELLKKTNKGYKVNLYTSKQIEDKTKFVLRAKDVILKEVVVEDFFDTALYVSINQNKIELHKTIEDWRKENHKLLHQAQMSSHIKITELKSFRKLYDTVKGVYFERAIRYYRKGYENAFKIKRGLIWQNFDYYLTTHFSDLRDAQTS